MMLKEFRDRMRRRALSTPQVPADARILALLDYLDALEKASAQVIGEYDDIGTDGVPSPISLSALRIALAKRETEI